MPFSDILIRRTPTMNAGRLRHKVDIVVSGQVQDSTGGWSKTDFVVYANVWAAVIALTGNERYAVGQFVSTVTHQVIIRYIGAAPSWQKGTNYNALALIKDSNGYLQQAQGPGTSGATAPATWNQNVGQTTTDNTVTWKNIGIAPAYTGVCAKMNVRFQGRTMQIEAVLNPDERNKSLVLNCIEINDSRNQMVSDPGAGGGTTP